LQKSELTPYYCIRPNHEAMNEWWEALSSFEKILWGFAIPSSLIFALQTIMTFVGMDSDGGIDADGDADFADDSDSEDGPFQLFTFRNMVNFFLGFSWAGISLNDYIENRFVLGLVAFIIGALLVFLVMMIFIQMGKMVQSGTMDYRNAVGHQCEVYLGIPAENSGRGKVHVMIQGALRELDAITLGDTLASGSQARVVEVRSGHILVVEKV